MTAAVRSLNLATAVAVVVYDAVRRLGLGLEDGRPAP